MIIVVAAWELTKDVLILVGQGVVDPLDYRTFQAIFGEIMIVLISIEFKHSIIRIVAHRRGIIQVQTVPLLHYSPYRRNSSSSTQSNQLVVCRP